MNLDDAQKRAVTDWIAGGLKLSEIQKRAADELGLHLTYMEVRLLVDDLKLTPKDVGRAKPVELAGKQPGPAAAGELHEEGGGDPAPPRSASGISLQVDQVT